MSAVLRTYAEKEEYYMYLNRRLDHLVGLNFARLSTEDKMDLFDVMLELMKEIQELGEYLYPARAEAART